MNIQLDVEVSPPTCRTSAYLKDLYKSPLCHWYRWAQKKSRGAKSILVKFQVPNSITFRDMNYYPVTDRRTESDAYEPIVQYAQVSSKRSERRKMEGSRENEGKCRREQGAIDRASAEGTIYQYTDFETSGM